MNKPLIVLLTGSLILMGCTSPGLEKRLKVTTIEETRPTLAIPPTEPLDLETPRYFVITPETSEAVFEALKKEGLQPVIVGTTVGGLSVIITNNVKIQQIIQKYQDDIKAQQKYYTSPVN